MESGSFVQNVANLFVERIAQRSAVWQRDVRTLLPSMPLTLTKEQDVPLSGGNALLLAQMMVENKWQDPRFFTEANIAELGAQVRPGAVSCDIQFVRSTSDDGLALVAREAVTFQVYNAQDVEGLEEWEQPSRDWSLETLGNRLLPKFEIDIVHDQLESAFFSREDGKVHMPPLRLFPSIAAYVGVAIHELCHGSSGELDRDVSGSVGTVSYAKEELRAEMASMQLSVALGLPHDIERHAGFAGEWQEILKADPGEFFRAARDAEKMAALVLWHVKAIQREIEVEREAATTPQSRSEAPVSRGGSTRAQYLTSLKFRFENRLAILAVPFSEKDEAKAAGAVYYGAEKCWFVPPGADLAKLKKWNPREVRVLSGIGATRADMLGGVKDLMRELGFKMTDRLDTEMADAPNGKFGYASVVAEGNKYNRSGAWVLYFDGSASDSTPYAVIINNKSGVKRAWRYDGPELTSEQQARMRQNAIARDAQLAKEEALVHGRVALQAAGLWGRAVPMQESSEHGYCVKKGIEPNGSRLATGDVLLEYPAFTGDSGKSIIRADKTYLLRAIRDIEGKIWSIQAINEDGSVKTFMSGGRKRGLFDLIGADSIPADGKLIFAESFSTGSSLAAGSGAPVLNCLDAGNLEVVVKELGSKLPQAVTPIIGSDNDQFFVERSLAMLTSIGVNNELPGNDGNTIKVFAGPNIVREVNIGEAVADGQWHQGTKGRYKLALEMDSNNLDVCRKLVLETVEQNAGIDATPKTLRASNRGAEAAAVALSALPRAIVATPVFKSLEGKPTDWNDLATKEGKTEVRSQLSQQLGLSLVPASQSVERNAYPAREKVASFGR